MKAGDDFDEEEIMTTEEMIKVRDDEFNEEKTSKMYVTFDAKGEQNAAVKEQKEEINAQRTDKRHNTIAPEIHQPPGCSCVIS